MKRPGKKRYRSVVLDFIRYLLRYRLTLMGRQLVSLGVILVFISGFIFYSTFLIYSLVVFLCLIFVLNPVLTWILNPGLEVSVDSPTRAAAGSFAIEEVTLKNKTRRNAYLVAVREDRPPDGVKPREPFGLMIPLIPPGGEVTVSLCLDFPRRGSFTLKGIGVDSTFPLGITRTGPVVKKERHLLIYPRFEPLQQLEIPVGRKLQPGGIALASEIGESTEFRSTREFRTGDDPRYIHWSSWARLNKPVVKEFHEEYYVRIALFLDSFVPDGAQEENYEAFEALLSLGAGISDYLQRQEYVIDIIAAGPQIYYLQAGRSLACLDQILDILACIEPCREKPYHRLEPHLIDELYKISTVIVLLLDVDTQRVDFLMKLRDLGVDVKLLVVNPEPSSVDLSTLGPLGDNARVLTPDEVERGPGIL